MRRHCWRSRRRLFVGALAILALLVPAVASATTTLTTVPGTAVLLSKGGSGPLSSTSSNTNIFAPAAYVDYKRFGGEPTVTVDRYPFPGSNTSAAAKCSGTTPCFKDVIYASSPNGFAYPHYSPFWKSDDLGMTFRVPCHFVAQGQTCATGGGGGDSHTAVGQVTHRLFFVDLPGPGCVTVNISDDLGETFVGDNAGCGPNPGAIDDRQWVEADEKATPCNGGTGQNAYISFINFTNLAAPSLSLARSCHDGNTGTFVSDSVCNTLNAQTPAGLPINPLPTGPSPDSTPTPCPDPADKDLQVAGPVVADKESYSGRPNPTHNLYIPFIRGTAVIPGLTSGPPYSLWVAKSIDSGTTWTRLKVAELGNHNPINIFPQLTIDRGGNLYYTWSQTQGPGQDSSGLLGEQDVYYAFSTTGGATWSPPIDLTQSANNTAIMPWMVAGDPGQVDLVYYQANTGLNSNVAFVDTNGSPCDVNNTEADCNGNGTPNPSVWNTFFGQSQNALNTGSNFKNVQITDHPNHIGQVCTAGLACSGDRDLLDFLTVDLDHLGAANAIWSDDNTTRTTDTRNKYAHQLSGASVYKNTSINLWKTWPITDHSVTDPSGDTTTAIGTPNGSCAGMDILGVSEQRSGDLITVSMTLNAVPDFAKAVVCAPSGVGATGGLWGVEFWAAREPSASGTPRAENFYIAYRDNPPDGPPRVEGGRMDDLNGTITSLEFDPTTAGTPQTPSGTCFKPPVKLPCTLTMTVSAQALGMKQGAGMYSITGLSVFEAGQAGHPTVVLRVELGNSEQSDAATPFDDNGTGSTSP
jgi:hypothetical protein